MVFIFFFFFCSLQKRGISCAINYDSFFSYICYNTSVIFFKKNLIPPLRQIASIFFPRSAILFWFLLHCMLANSRAAACVLSSGYLSCLLPGQYAVDFFRLLPIFFSFLPLHTFNKIPISRKKSENISPFSLNFPDKAHYVRTLFT